jgi:hypothetical protein
LWHTDAPPPWLSTAVVGKLIHLCCQAESDVSVNTAYYYIKNKQGMWVEYEKNMSHFLLNVMLDFFN